MVVDDKSKGEHVNDEQGWTNNRTPWDTAGNRVGLGRCTSQEDVFCSSGEVGTEPVEQNRVQWCGVDSENTYDV